MELSKTLLAMTIAATLTGCNGGGSGSSSDSTSTDNSNTTPTPAARVVVPVDSAFTAMFKASIDHNTTLESASAQRERKARTVSYFEGTLTATNVATGESESFDWPVTADDAGQVTSEKTVTIEPGTYNFSLMVSRGSQQYTALLNDYLIEDEGEYRLNMDISPVIGDTIVNVDEITTLSRLKLEFPPEELVSVDAPQIGFVVNGVEQIYQINTTTGIADITLNLEEGAHTYDVNLYNGNNLIARSRLGEQTVDLVQGDDLIVELISLQADITVDFSDLPNPRFIFNVPQEVVDHVGDINNLNLLARISDGEHVQEVTLTIQEEDGRYFAEHIFEETENNDITAYVEFLDLTTGTAETIASCADSITVFDINTMTCGIELSKDYVIGGNLLATLSINVLNQQKVAEAGATVFLDSKLIGITGENFGTPGFIKTHVKAGEEHTVLAVKGELSDMKTLTPTALEINNFDLILVDNTKTPAVFSASNTYPADAPEGAFDLYHRSEYTPAGGYYSFLDEQVKRGVWVGIWGNNIGAEGAYDQWLQADFLSPITVSGFTPVGTSDRPGRTPDTITVWVDQGNGLEEYQTFSMDNQLYKEIWFDESLNNIRSIRFHMNASQGIQQDGVFNMDADILAIDEIFILK